MKILNKTSFNKLNNFFNKIYFFLKKNFVFVILLILVLINILININILFPDFRKNTCFIKNEDKFIGNGYGIKKEFIKRCINGVCITNENEFEITPNDIKDFYEDIMLKQKYIQREFDILNKFLLDQSKFFETLYGD